MKFCPKCKSIMMPTKEGDKTILECKSCGYKEESEETKLKLQVKEKKKEEIKVLENESEALTAVDAKCSECGNDKAYFHTLQTRAADEPETQFYKCTKCGHSWRENA